MDILVIRATFGLDVVRLNITLVKFSSIKNSNTTELSLAGIILVGRQIIGNYRCLESKYNSITIDQVKKSLS